MLLALVISVLINDYVSFGKSYFRMVFLFRCWWRGDRGDCLAHVLFGNGGIVNLLTGAVSGTPSYFDWLGSEAWIKPLVVLLVIWRWTGGTSSSSWRAAAVDPARYL